MTIITKKIENQFSQSLEVLKKFNKLENFSKIENASTTILNGLKKGGKIISCGNGGSMSDAMHFAEELTGKYREERPSIPAISISDPSHITCVGNDYGFDFIFSRYIESIGSKNDILLAISTSGNSKNIINAIKAARQKKMEVIALTGFNGGKIAELCKYDKSINEIRVPHNEYSDRIQEIHIKIIHSLIKIIEDKLN
ncbi:MAG: phosphoheptose isomerase [Crocinitomicaceae bacterium]|nr:phosphoheptose isomerase [Crocinitomicaceae bacterium]|tara:strand:+ start:36677 stop:37270 length:594 start_codon:yes stop_codon:yes gene_type:complete